VRPRRRAAMEEGVEEHTLSGFDPQSEPHVRRTATGRLWLGIEFLPPSWAPEGDPDSPRGLGPGAGFDPRLATAIGVPVVWVDREWFRIEHPREDTVRAIHQFLLEEKQRFIVERRCLDPEFDEVMRLDSALRWWKERSGLAQTRYTASAS